MEKSLRPVLFAKSHFSIGESLLEVEEIVDEAKRLGYAAACLCDTMTVSGMIDFSKRAQKAGIQPIIGVRLRIVDDLDYRAPKKGSGDRKKQIATWYPKLIARTEEGMQVILRLLSLANDEAHFYYEPRLSLADLLNELRGSDACYLLTGDVLSAFHPTVSTETLEEIGRTVASNLTLSEIVPVDTPYFDKINYRAMLAAEKYGWGVIVTSPTFYTEGRADSAIVLGAICNNQSIDAPWVLRPHNADAYPLKPKSLAVRVSLARARINGRFPDCPAGYWRAGLEGNFGFADKIEYQWKKAPISLPKLADDEYEALVKECRIGWLKRFGGTPVFGDQPAAHGNDLRDKYKPRLEFELGVLKKMGFCGYFLLVQNIVRWSKENGILVGPGRGSVGGSLVAYLMGITDCDPLRFDLLFERFINPDRIDLPDADLDFMSDRRHEVVEYITKTWGEEYVAGISNYATLASASALRDAGRVFGLNPIDLACTKLVPKEHGQSVTLTQAAEAVTEIDIFRRSHAQIWDHALALEGKMRSFGRHAAGVVVSGVPLTERAVVERRKDGATVNWDKRVSEDQGLVKLDILGLSTLDTIKIALDYIFNRHSKKIDINAIPLDDPDVLSAFGRGETVGVFQFESGGMRKLLKDLASYEPLKFDDIAAATALYRPGPMDSGLMEDYVNIKQGLASVTYDHPNMEPALRDTYGVIVYQEQVMRVARDLAGFTLTESDHLRKAMGKKDKDLMATFRDKWVDGCASFSSMDKIHAGDLFDKIEKFAGYGFNKSHAVEYSLISYQMMWLKVKYPVEFYAAGMSMLAASNKQDADQKIKSLIKDALTHKIEVLPPDINISSGRFEIMTDDIVVAPFNVVKGISDNTARVIVAAREGGPFKDFADFFARVDKRRCNVRHQASLRSVGAFARIEPGELDARHPDRKKDQIALMPSVVIDYVRANREIEVPLEVKKALVGLVQEYRDATSEYLPSVTVGKSPKFMVITDAPTKDECDEGKIGKGRSFAPISEAMHLAGLDHNEGYYTCLSKAPKVKTEAADGKDKSEITNDQMEMFLPILRKEIDLLKPPVIVCLGSTTARQFIKGMKGSIVDNCGTVVFDPTMDASIVVGISPGMIYFDNTKQALLNDVFSKVAEIIR